MSGLDIFALIVLTVLALVALAAWVVLAMLPGRIARSRGHPQADAINAGGWLGAMLGGVLWPIFFVWAFTKPIRPTSGMADTPEAEALSKRVAALEAQLAAKAGNAT
jgi:hypothetical protein